MSRQENSFKKYLLRVMGTLWDVQSHEDKYSPGIPDLSYGVDQTNGWIELKYINEWKPNGNPVKPDHYTAIQVNWLNRRGKKGGNCFIMVHIAADTFLLSFEHAKRVRAGMNREQYRKYAIGHWAGPVQSWELKDLLSGGCERDQLTDRIEELEEELFNCRNIHGA